MSAEETLFGMPAERGRWILILLGMVIQLCLGAIYAYSVIRVPLATYFQSTGLKPTAMDMTWPFIAFLLLFALTMPIAGPYIQRFGPRKVCMAGGALCGIGWIAASFATSPLTLALLYGVIGGIGVGIAYGCPIATSAQWFPDKRGLAVGLTVLGFGFSAALIGPVNDFLVVNYGGILNALRIFGIAFLIITVLLALALRFPPAGWKPAGWSPPQAVPGAAANAGFARNEMVRTRTFYGLWLCYTIGALAGLTAIGIAKPVGLEVAGNAGMTAIAAGALMTGLIFPFALCNGIGRPVFGALTDRFTPRNTAILTYLLILTACFLLYFSYASVTMYIISFALLWGCLGGWLAIAPTATASYFGMADNARNYGVVFTAYGAGAVIGGVISAQAKDILGAYQPFFLIVAGLAVVGIIIASVLMKPPVKNTV